MINFFRSSQPVKFPTSQLFDEKTFYVQFNRDLRNCKKEVIIESPYITSGRMRTLSPIFDYLLNQDVQIYILTRAPHEHEPALAQQAEEEIRKFEAKGIHTLLADGNHHRKLAILDRKILWEGSLNILSQTRSREVMRRIDGEEIAQEMFRFLKLGRHIHE